MLQTLDEFAEILGNPLALARQRMFEIDSSASGLAWGANLGDLKSRYGVSSWRDFYDVVFLPSADALELPRARFYHRWERDNELWPAYEFQSDFNSLHNYKANHELVIDILTRRYQSKAELRDVSNCLIAEWHFGLFAVTAHSFLPDRSKLGRNRLYTAHPDLWECTLVSVESRGFCNREEDASLAGLPGPPFRSLAVESGDAKIGAGCRLTNRLLPVAIRAKIPTTSYLVWCDATRLGVANPWASIVISRNTAGKVRLQERTPARGSGSAEIQVGQVSVFRSAQWQGLRRLAATLAEFFELGLEKVSYSDE